MTAQQELVKDSKKAMIDIKLENDLQMHKNMADLALQLENLNKMKVLADKNLVIVKGSVPGHKGSIVTIEK